MATNVFIVESPAKIKSLKGYLEPHMKSCAILASYGHTRDLIPKEGAVDPENDFAMKYQVIDKNEKHIKAILAACKNKSTKNLFLATDPDREGEAISWHVLEYLREQGVLDKLNVQRITFNEITKRAVLEAVENPRDVSMDLVNAQQARRALDYLVGFNLSPLLWKKIRRGLSAGRVQSPALRLIVEREQEIQKFEPKEYWTIFAHALSGKKEVSGKLAFYEGKKLSQFTISDKKSADKAQKNLIKLADGALTAVKVEKKQRKRNPAAPFITSTLQQEGVRKLGFSARSTMMTAQKLYEGIDIGDGAPVGLITYMRTDSVHLSNDAVTEIRSYIGEQYGKDALPSSPRVYKTKSKSAQEAHEAIRPTSVHVTPSSIKKYLTPQQFKLYDLVWKRTVASQMIHATMNTVAIDLACGEGDNVNTDNYFRANGSVVATPGFMAVYLEGNDDQASDDSTENLLPEIKEGDVLKLNAKKDDPIECNQHFTEPPPRYSEASLVKTLEEYGIGRPSTYASIISTLLAREYVIIEQKRFHPTDVGEVVNRFLTEHFTRYVDYDFTATLEDKLDAIARGEQQWVPVLDEFWGKFHKQIEEKETDVSRADVTQEALDENCPECSKPLSVRLGRRGKFVGCTGYPECNYTRNMDGEEMPSEPEVVKDRTCPKCDSELIIRMGRYGKFIGCSAYPKCKHIESLEKPADTGVKCPECKQGAMVSRKSRYGKIFYSCERYPDCKYAVWNPPINESCPDCKWPILTKKTTKRRGTEKVCPQKECNHTEQIEAPEK